MKEGVKVEVVSCITGHKFKIGEIVERRLGEHEDSTDSLGFYSEDVGLWYMDPDEYKIVGSTISLLSEALTFAENQNFSSYVLTGIKAVIELAEQELENK